MLAILGMLGALCAGIVVESMVRSGPADEDGPEGSGSDESADPEEADGVAGTSILDWSEGDPPEAAAGEGEPSAVVATQAAARSAEPASAGSATSGLRLGPEEGGTYDGMPVSDDGLDPEDPPMDLAGDDRANIMTGGGAADRIAGGGGNDLIAGRGGADRVDAGAGADQVRAGEGTDTVFGRAGADVLHGEDGDDSVNGGAGRDELCGQEGDDTLLGGGGADTLMGGGGSDRLFGGAGQDMLAGGDGHDLLAGGAGSDTLDGGAGNDTLWGQMPNDDDATPDFLNGGDGDDSLMLGAGDFGHGGAGADRFEMMDGFAGGPVAQISDYDPDADSLVVVYDPSQHPDPQITLEPVDGSGDVTLLLDGVPLATVQNAAGLTADQVLLRAA